VQAHTAHTRAQSAARKIGPESAAVAHDVTGTRRAQVQGMKTSNPSYQIDKQWRIERANDEFCRAFKCTQAGLIGRDVRELVRADWHRDFRNYVSQALIGIGAREGTVPMMAPCGAVAWYRHVIEPLLEDGAITGYRATLTPHGAPAVAAPRRWWQWRPTAPIMVWNFDLQPQTLAKAS
jgi:PAS domain-containing protein